MSEKQKLTKAQRKKIRRTSKRKASGSPDIEVGGHISTDTPPGTGLSNTQDFDESERYVNTVLSFNTSPIMNIGQQQGMYGYQTPQQQPQQPQHYQQQAQTPVMYTSTPMSPPAWAIPLIEDVKSIKSTMPKIAEIENSIKTINSKITTIDNKISNLDKKVNDMENAVSFISNEHDLQKTELIKAREETKKIKEMCKSLDQKLQQCTEHEETTTDKLLDLEARSMRDNLMFYGIQETQTTHGGDPENCESLVKNLINTKLQLDTSEMKIDRAHRIGGERARKPRPIVVKFHQYADREAVRRKSLDEAVKASLRGSNMGIGVQSPQQYREARKALADYAKEEEQRGNRARIVGTKLLVNNKPAKKYINGSVIDL